MSNRRKSKSKKSNKEVTFHLVRLPTKVSNLWQETLSTNKSTIKDTIVAQLHSWTDPQSKLANYEIEWNNNSEFLSLNERRDDKSLLVFNGNKIEEIESRTIDKSDVITPNSDQLLENENYQLKIKKHKIINKVECTFDARDKKYKKTFKKSMKSAIVLAKQQIRTKATAVSAHGIDQSTLSASGNMNINKRSKKNKRKQSKVTEHDEKKVAKLIMAAFEQKSHLSIDTLSKYTDQPKYSLKLQLEKYCNYEKTGMNAKKWTLKTEYQISS